MKYRKRPLVIDAVQWKGNNFNEIETELDAKHTVVHTMGMHGEPNGTLTVYTLSGPTKAERGDWVLRGTHGEIYPCKARIFVQTYKEV